MADRPAVPCDSSLPGIRGEGNLPLSLDEEVGGSGRWSAERRAATISCLITSRRESDTRSPSGGISGVGVSLPDAIGT